MAEIVDATDMDFARFFKINPPNSHWFGKSMKDGRLVKAMAGAVQIEDGRYFGFMDLKGAARYPLIFRVFKRFMDDMPHGITELFVACDTGYRNSDVFLSRLGFRQTDEMLGDLKVWKWQTR